LPVVDAQVVGFSTEFSLVQRCRAGEAPAWQELYDAHFDFVYGIAKRLGTPDAEADDVVQETFLVAFKKLSSFTDGRFTTWLYRIAANVASSRHRRRRIRRALQSIWGSADEKVVDGPDATLESREAESIVGSVLERMSPKKREVFALFEIEGLSGEEIAERAGCGVETVWSRLHYARKDFERMLRERMTESR
jgi:RNA polymerase sigma-70 factor, ECF subfamily